MIKVFLEIVQVLRKLETVIDFYPEFDLSEVGIGDDYFSEDARPDHPDEGLHFLEVGVQRVGDNIVDFVWRLVFEHEEVGVDADEVLSHGSFFGCFDQESSIFFADQLNVAF